MVFKACERKESRSNGLRSYCEQKYMRRIARDKTQCTATKHNRVEAQKRFCQHESKKGKTQRKRVPHQSQFVLNHVHGAKSKECIWSFLATRRLKKTRMRFSFKELLAMHVGFRGMEWHAAQV